MLLYFDMLLYLGYVTIMCVDMYRSVSHNNLLTIEQHLGIFPTQPENRDIIF